MVDRQCWRSDLPRKIVLSRATSAARGIGFNDLQISPRGDPVD
jgi:hypothetical protein